MPKESNSIRPSESPPRDIPDLAFLQRRLTSVLSVVAGTVDVISFVSLKLFAAHITGNLVVIAAMLVSGGPPRMDQILAVPVFFVAVAVVWLIARRFDRPGHSQVRVLLLVHLLIHMRFDLQHHQSSGREPARIGLRRRGNVGRVRYGMSVGAFAARCAWGAFHCCDERQPCQNYSFAVG